MWGWDPPDSFPHTAARGYKPALQGRPFLPGREVRDPVGAWLWGSPGLPNPPGSAVPHSQGTTLLCSCLVRVPWPALCLCLCSRTPAHGATARLTLGPGSPADPRCPVCRESHCKESTCGVRLGCPLPSTHSPGPPTHPVVPWWSWWPHGTRHARGPWLSGPARAPWHAWQPILALLSLRADGTGW